MATKLDVSTAKGLAAFNGMMTTKSYCEGFSFSPVDSEVFAKLTGAPEKAQYPHAYRWFIHVAALKGVRGSVVLQDAVAWGKKAPKAATAAPPAAKAKAAVEDDDDVDLFGDDDEAEAAPKAKAPTMKEKMEAAKKDKEKAKKVERSQVVLEVKPWEAEADLVSLFNKISAVKVEGLVWGEAYKLVPVAFGVKKLVISCVIEDEKVGVEDITDAIEQFEDEVQSVDMTTMNRL
ncbi:unnamed protein product [Phaeothamnion confervicola]